MAVILIQRQSRYASGIEVIAQGADDEIMQNVRGHLAALAIGIGSPEERTANPFSEKFIASKQLENYGTYDKGSELFTDKTYQRACERLFAAAIEQPAYEAADRDTFEIERDTRLLDSFINDAEYGLMTHQGLAADEHFEAVKFPLKPLTEYESELVKQNPRLRRRSMQYEVSDRIAASSSSRLEDAAHESLGFVDTADNRYVPVVTVLSDSYLAARAANVAMFNTEPR